MFTLKKPFWAFILVPIGTYMGYFIQLFENATIPFSLFQISLIYFVIIFILNRLVYNRYEVRLLNLEVELLIFFLIIFLSIIYSPNRGEGLFYATRILILIFMVYLIINTLQNTKEIVLILYIIITISLILSILSIREGLLNPEKILWDYFSMGKKLVSRALVNQKDPNIFASHLLLPLFFLSSFIMTRENNFYHRLLAFVFFSIISIGLISTLSRSAWISAIFGMLILVLMFRQYKLLMFFLILIILTLIFFPNSSFLISNVINRFLGIFAGRSDPSSNIRIFLGVGALNIIADSYLLGIGFRGFPMVITNYFTKQKLLGVLEPHSVFYAIFAELGLIGFLIYSWILYRIIIVAYRNFKFSTNKNEKIISATLFVSFLSYIIFYEFYGGGLVDNNLWVIVSLIFTVKLLMKRSIS